MNRNHNQEGWESPSSLFNKLKFSSLLAFWKKLSYFTVPGNWFQKNVFAPFRLDRSGRGKKWRGDITLHWILCGGDGWGQLGFDQNNFAISISFLVVFRVWCTLKEDTFFFYEICAVGETLVFMFNVKLFTEIVNQISFHWKSYFRWLWGQNWVILFRQIKSSPDSVPPIWQLQTQSAKVRKFAVFRWN